MLFKTVIHARRPTFRAGRCSVTVKPRLSRFWTIVHRFCWLLERLPLTMATPPTDEASSSETNTNNNTNTESLSSSSQQQLSQKEKEIMLADEDPLLISQSLTYVTDDGEILHSFYSAPFSTGTKQNKANTESFIDVLSVFWMTHKCSFRLISFPCFLFYHYQ